MYDFLSLQLGGGRSEGTDAVWLFDALLNYYIESKSKRTLLILSGIRNNYADYLLQRLEKILPRKKVWTHLLLNVSSVQEKIEICEKKQTNPWKKIYKCSASSFL